MLPRCAHCSCTLALVVPTLHTCSPALPIRLLRPPDFPCSLVLPSRGHQVRRQLVRWFRLHCASAVLQLVPFSSLGLRVGRPAKTLIPLNVGITMALSFNWCHLGTQYIQPIMFFQPHFLSCFDMLYVRACWFPRRVENYPVSHLTHLRNGA